MNIKFEFNIEQNDEELLANIFSLKKRDDSIDNNALRNKLSSIAKASFEEYIRMILGQKVFSRGKDIMEYRMFLLIKEAHENKIPEEELVSSLFQTTSSESRSLIRSVLSKYQYELKNSINDTLINILSYVEKQNEKIIVVIYNDSIKDELNRILTVRKKGALRQIQKDKGTIANYIIPDDSYDELCKHFDIEPKEFDSE